MTARLYLRTPPALDIDHMAGALTAALGTGTVACVRLDLGEAEEQAWRAAAERLLPLCHGADVPLVVTDHHRLVRPLRLDGVHLARSRAGVRALRDELPRDSIVGVFAGASRHRGMTAAEAGADYVAFGPVAAPGALGDDDGPVEDEVLAWWAEMIETPQVAEGGVTLDDARRLGPVVDFLTPQDAVWEDDGIADRLRAFAEAMGPPPGDD